MIQDTLSTQYSVLTPRYTDFVMVWHGSTYIVPQDRSFQGTLYFFGQVDSVPRGLAVLKWAGEKMNFEYKLRSLLAWVQYKCNFLICLLVYAIFAFS